MLSVALRPKSPMRSFKVSLRHELQTMLSIRAVTTTQTRAKSEFAALAPMTFFGLHGSDRGSASPPTLLLTSVLSRLRDTNSVQTLAIFGFLEIVKFWKIAQPYKEAWGADFSAVWVFADHVGVGTCAILG